MQGKHYLQIIKDSLEANGWRYNASIDSQIARRRAGDRFSINEHIRAMVYAMLSNRVPWHRISNKVDRIDQIFGRDINTGVYGYDASVLKNTDPNEYIRALRKEKCGNLNINKQMHALKYNIEVLERINNSKGGLDGFLNNTPAEEVVRQFSNSKSSKKLKEMGDALVYEYIRGVGVDAAKPDVHLRRFLSSSRMGTSVKADEASVKEVTAQVSALASATGFTKAGVDAIIWTFCSNTDSSYGEVCTARPRCYECPVRARCQYGGDFNISLTEAIKRSIVNASAIIGRMIDIATLTVSGCNAGSVLSLGKNAVRVVSYEGEILSVYKVEGDGTPYAAETALCGLADRIMDDEGRTVDIGNGTRSDVVGMLAEKCEVIDVECGGAPCDVTIDMIHAILRYKYTPKY